MVVYINSFLSETIMNWNTKMQLYNQGIHYVIVSMLF